MAKERKHKVFYLLLAVLVLAAGMPLSAGAARVFTDVGDGEWYDTYVMKAYEAGLISGFEDATFKPNSPISKMEAIICLARLAGFGSDTAVDSYIQKFNTRMDSDRIPVWAKGYVAFALEKGIVTEEEIATFVKSDGSSNNAKRYEVAVYFARALGFEQQAGSMTNVVLNFVDNEVISNWSKGYIKVLYDRGIMKGDSQNKFNPNNEITRAEIATMLSSSLEHAGTVNTGTSTVEGRIDEVVTSTGRTVIKISDTDDEIDMYDVATAVTVRLNGTSASLSSIAAGQQGTFGIRDDKIVSIDVVSRAGTVKGIVRSVYIGSGFSSITIEEDDDGDRLTYRLMANAVIRLDGQTVGLEQISSGDSVTVTASDTYATRVEAERKTKTAMGIFAGLKTDKNLILVLKKGSQETEYPVDDDAQVRRDGRNRGFEDLRRGDEIEITIEYGIVTKIEADSVDREVEGTLESLAIGRPHQLTILKKDGETETFILPVDVKIELDGKTASVYDLRLDYFLEIEVESDEVVGIEAESVADRNEVMGTVEYVNTDVNVITLKDSGTNTLRQINVNDDTRIMNSSGTRRYMRHIDVGDRLVVFGRSELGVFIADSVIIRD